MDRSVFLIPSDGTGKISQAFHESIGTSYPVGQVDRLAFKPDGASLLIANHGGSLVSYEIADEHSHKLDVEVSPQSNSLRWIGDHIIAGSMSGFSIIEHESLKQSDVEADLGRGKAAFTADGRLCFTPSGGIVKKWDFDSIPPTLVGSKDIGLPIDELALSANGKRAALRSSGEVFLLDPATLNLMRIPGAIEVWCFEFSPDSRTLALGGDRGVQLLDLSTEDRQLELLSSNSCRSLTFSPNGQHLVTTQSRGIVTQWDLDTKQKLWRRLLPGQPKVHVLIPLLAIFFLTCTWIWMRRRPDHETPISSDRPSGDHVEATDLVRRE